MLRALLILILPLMGWAQSAPTGDGSSSQPPGYVQGRVANAETGDGISGATIRLVPLRTSSASATTVRSGTSQADGSFTVDNVTPGSYFVVASQPNFSSSPDASRSRALNVGPGQAVTNVSIQLNPMGRIHGRVLDDEGNPIQGATVEGYSTYSLRGKTQLRRSAQATSDEQGRFSLRTQAVGRYYVDAELQKEPDAAKKTDDQNPAAFDQPAPELVRTFYAKALNIESATPVDLTPGQDAPEITIQLVRTVAHHVRGRIDGLAVDGLTRGGPILALAPKGSLASDGIGAITRLQKDGTFDIAKVVPGSYTLTATGAAPADEGSGGEVRPISRRRLLARQDVDVGAGDVNGIVLTVIPLMTLSGRVSMDGADNVDLSSVRVNLLSMGTSAGGTFQSASAQRDGSFQMQDVAPGEYLVHISGAPSGTYVRTVTYNRQDISTTGIDLTEGGGGEIAVVLRNGTGEVDGALEATGQIPATTVMILVPDALSVDGSGVMLANMQSTGGFVIRNVPPGRYYALAVERWSPVWQNSDFLRSVQNQGSSLDLPENGHLQVQLSLFSSEQVQAAAEPLGLTSQ